MAAKKSRIMKPRCPLGYEMWRYSILPYCDLSTLLRLVWTNMMLRRVINDPDFIVEWQTSCWFMYRECLCKRNIFYLHIPEFCSYAYDYSPTLDSQWEARIRLRDMGRSPYMHLMAHGLDRIPLKHGTSSFVRQKYCDPVKERDEFHHGVFQVWIENLIVPLPRMVGVHVEDTLLPPCNEPRGDTESEQEYEKRRYWRNFHDVNEAVELQRTTGQVLPSGFIPFVYRDVSIPGILRMVSSERNANADALDQYIKQAERDGRNPYDPMDDPECEGHSVCQWARNRMYTSLLGNMGYPLELCLRKDELDPPYAQRNGVDYIERLFIPVQKIHPHATMMDHRGVVYFNPVRYTNEQGDAVNWILGTWACMNAVYIHVWFDTMYQMLEMLCRHATNLAHEIEEDTRREALMERWVRLGHLNECAQCQEPNAYYHRTGEDGERDQKALHFVRNGVYNGYFHRLACTIHRWRQLQNETPGLVNNSVQHWLVGLIPTNVTVRSIHRNESQLVRDLDTLLEVTSFITEFGECLGARASHDTIRSRRKTLNIYLASGFSLLAFSPTWCREPSWKPSLTHEWGPMGMPTSSATNNHRFVRYLDFLNRRALFYNTDSSLARHAKHEDLGKDQ